MSFTKQYAKVEKYSGAIWFHDIQQTTTVNRVLFRGKNGNEELVVDFIENGYHYTAILKMKEPDIYTGEYFCEVDGIKYTDTANCKIFRNKNELLLHGNWVEDGINSVWYCRLQKIGKFPDEK